MFWVCRNTFSESYFALTYRPSFGRMTSPRTDPFSSVATFSDITSTLPSQGYRRNFSSAFSVDDDLLLDTLPDKAVNELGPEHHFPIQGNLHRSHTWETLEGVVLRGHLAQAVGPAEQVFLRGILRLVNQFGVAEHTFHTRERCVPCDHAVDVVRPDFHRQPAVHLPCDPCDVRRAERLYGLVSVPIRVEGDE